MANKMVVTQPEPVMISQYSQEWSSNICDCCQDLGMCCFAYWCCPCFACVQSREFGEPLCLPLLEIFGGCIPPITMSMRLSMRQRYGIKGTLCNDCVMATCCMPCVWCQMAREMKARGNNILLVNAKNT